MTQRLACVAGVKRGREGGIWAREGESLSFLPRAPKFPLPLSLLTPDTQATQRQKFHTDDAYQCLHNKSGSHGVPNIYLSNFTCLLVDFVSFVFICQRAPARLKCFFWRGLYSTNIGCFVSDSSRSH